MTQAHNTENSNVNEIVIVMKIVILFLPWDSSSGSFSESKLNLKAKGS